MSNKKEYKLKAINNFNKNTKEYIGTAEEILSEFINMDMFDNEGFASEYGISFWGYEDEDYVKGYEDLHELSDEFIQDLFGHFCSYDYTYYWEEMY